MTFLVVVFTCRSAVKSGHMTVRTANTDVRRPPPPLGRTVFSREMKNPRQPSQQPLRSATSKANHVAYLRALKEQFQRDIDDTVAKILSEEVCTYCILYLPSLADRLSMHL